LLLGGDSGGSYALSRDKTQQFGLIVDSCLKELKETYEKDFLKPLWALNGWDEDLMPTFSVEKIQYRDITEVTTALKDLAAAGLAPDDEAINILRGILGLPDAPEVDELDLALAQQALMNQNAPTTPEEEAAAMQPEESE